MLANDLRLSVSIDWQKQFASSLDGRSAHTLQAYLQDVRAFASWFATANGERFSPDLITSIDLRGWRKHSLEIEQAAPATWNRRRATMTVLCAWLQAEGILTYDPSNGLEPAEAVDLPPRWLEKSELAKFQRQVERLVNAAGAGTDLQRRRALRDQAMISLMIHAGLREFEVCGLQLADVELRERSGRVIVRLGKGEKRREIPLNAEARRAITVFLAVRGDAPGALIGGISTRTVQRVVAEVGRLAGLSVSPHDLRHTFAKRMVDSGQPLTVVQRLLGHSRLDTTARYVQPGWGDLERAVENVGG